MLGLLVVVLAGFMVLADFKTAKVGMMAGFFTAKVRSVAGLTTVGVGFGGGRW